MTHDEILETALHPRKVAMDRYVVVTLLPCLKWGNLIIAVCNVASIVSRWMTGRPPVSDFWGVVLLTISLSFAALSLALTVIAYKYLKRRLAEVHQARVALLFNHQ